MTELLKRNYDAVVKRGLINPQTTSSDFMAKLEEETMEVYVEHMRGNKDKKTIELGDVINTCNNWLIWLGYDPEEILKQVAIKNEKRHGKTTSTK